MSFSICPTSVLFGRASNASVVKFGEEKKKPPDGKGPKDNGTSRAGAGKDKKQ